MKKSFLLCLLICCSAFAFGQWHIDEDFEGITTLPAGWITYDDGDGMTWRNLEMPVMPIPERVLLLRITIFPIKIAIG